MLNRRLARVLRSERQRGATAVEAAIVVPLFLALILGAVEVSLLLLDTNAVRNGARIGAHEGSRSASSALADFNVITSAAGTIKGMSNAVDGLIIYKATAPGAPPDPLCVAALDAGGTGVASLCNVYPTARLKTVSNAWFGFTPVTNPNPLLWDKHWPATGRREALSGTQRPDLLGVYVRVRHRSLTGVIPARTLTAYAVNEIEPQRSE